MLPNFSGPQLVHRFVVTYILIMTPFPVFRQNFYFFSLTFFFLLVFKRKNAESLKSKAIFLPDSLSYSDSMEELSGDFLEEPADGKYLTKM